MWLHLVKNVHRVMVVLPGVLENVTGRTVVAGQVGFIIDQLSI